MANARGDAEAETALDRELDRHPFPENDLRIVGADAQSISTDLYRLASHPGPPHEVDGAGGFQSGS